MKAATDSALSGVRVLDLSEDVAGPYASKLLAGLGAEVIKVEPPGSGDRSRSRGPFFHDRPNHETSAPFLYLNTAKLGITLQVRHEQGRRLLLRLLEDADILIESYGPGGLEACGLEPDWLRQRFPRLIILRISDFGQSGPYAGFLGEDIVLQALGGLLFLSGDPDKPPLLIGGRQSYYLAGVNAFVILNALLLEQVGPRDDAAGSVTDLSVLECVAASLETATHRFAARGEIAERDGNWANRAAWGIYPCADGHVAVVSGDGLMFRKLGGLIAALDDPRYDSYEERRALADEINAQLLSWLSEHDKETIAAAGQRQRLPFGAVHDLNEVLRDPHLQARGFFERLSHPCAGEQSYPRAPVRLAGSTWQSHRAPLLGEHNYQIYCGRLGLTAGEIGRLQALEVI